MPTPPPRPNFFTAGDPLRALAALAIVLVHVAYQFAFQPGGLTGTFGDLPDRFFSALPVAVNVFFVLSGYLIVRPFVRAYLGGEDVPRVGRYLRNRALRILPAYWTVLTVLLLIFGSVGAGFWGVVGTYAFLQNLFLIPVRGLFLQSWSVIVEVGFYLLVPAAAIALTAVSRRADRRARLLIVAVALAVAWLGSAALRNAVPESIGPFDKLQFLSLSFLWSFVPGVALATIELTPALRERLARVRLLPIALLFTTLAGYGALMALHAAPGLERSWAVIVASTLTSAAAVAAPLTLQWSERPCWRWLDNAPLHWIGLRSYSLYLIHVTVIEQLRDPVFDVASGWGAFALLLALALPASLLLSHLTYQLVELPFLRRRLPWRRQPSEVPATA